MGDEIRTGDEQARANTQQGRPIREKQIQNEIIRVFGTRRDLKIWRANVGAARLRGQRVTFGVPGQADLTGILPDGRRLEIEVKSPDGVQSEVQKNYQKMIEKFNGVYILARSVDDVWARIGSLIT